MDLAEGGPLCPLLLPAVQHQLMEMWRAVNWSREPETILNGLDHLQDVQKKENSYIRLENLQLVRFFSLGTCTIIGYIPKRVCL